MMMPDLNKFKNMTRKRKRYLPAMDPKKMIKK